MSVRVGSLAVALLILAVPAADARGAKLRAKPAAAAVRATVTLSGPAVLRAKKVRVTVGGRKALVLGRKGKGLRVQVPVGARPGRRPVVARAGRRRARGKLRILKPFSGRVGLEVDAARAKSATVGPAGGAVTATGGDGTTYVLRVPPGALGADRAITLTPVKRFKGLPLKGGRARGVDLAPDGLAFAQPATLEITAKTAWPRTMVGFNAGGSFETIRPVLAGTVLRMAVPHFSAEGAAAATPADLAALAAPLLAKPDPLSLEDTREGASILEAFDIPIGGAAGCAAEKACADLKAKVAAGFTKETERRCGQADVDPSLANVDALVSLAAEAQAASAPSVPAVTCAKAAFGRVIALAIAGAEVAPFGGCEPAVALSSGVRVDLDGDGLVCHLELTLGLARYGAGLDSSAAQRGADAFSNTMKALLETLPELCETNRADAERQLGTLLVFADATAFQAVEARVALDKCRVTIAINPPTAINLEPGGEHQFIAQITGVFDVNSANHTWTANAGTVDQSGFYTAPQEPGTYTVKVTSDINPARAATATVTVGDQVCAAPQRRRAARRVVREGAVFIESAADVQELRDAGVTEITGALVIGESNPDFQPSDPRVDIPSLVGLEALETLRGSLIIRRTRSLANLRGLEGLRGFESDLEIDGNADLASLGDLAGSCGLTALSNLTVVRNPELKSLAGFEAISVIGGGVRLEENGLTSLAGLSGLDRTGSLTIGEARLPSLAGLEGLQEAGDITARFPNGSVMTTFSLPALRTANALSFEETGPMTVDLPLVDLAGGDLLLAGSSIDVLRAPNVQAVRDLIVGGHQATSLEIELAPGATVGGRLALFSNGVGVPGAKTISITRIAGAREVNLRNNQCVQPTLELGTVRDSLDFRSNTAMELAPISIGSVTNRALIQNNTGFTDNQATSYAAAAGVPRADRQVSGNSDATAPC